MVAAILLIVFRIAAALMILTARGRVALLRPNLP